MKFVLDRRFTQRVRGAYERFKFDVGVQRDAPHRNPRPKSAPRGRLEGGPVRRMKRSTNGTMASVLRELLKDVNFLRAPFKYPRSKDIREFLREFGEVAAGRSRSYSRVKSALRAVVRNPMLRGAYGSNSIEAIQRKGFNRKLIDTGQVYKAIDADVRVKR